MSESHLTQIRNYLLDKKLPIDILVEVYDHFITQILELEKEEGLGFEEAFDKVKITWKDELRPYWDGGWDLLDKNNMTRKFERMLIWTSLRKSLKYSLAAVIILALFSKLLAPQVFTWFFLIVVLAIVLWPIFNLIGRWKTFMLPKKYDNYVLTIYQSFNFLNLIFAYSFYQLISGFDGGASRFAAFFTNPQFNFDLAAMLMYFPLLVINFFTIVSQRQYLKRIEKVKPFLKHLNA